MKRSYLQYKVFGLILLMLLALSQASWAEERSCAVCCVEQNKIHTETCEISEQWNNKDYFFCNSTCQSVFLKDPERWSSDYDQLAQAANESASGEVVLTPAQEPVRDRESVAPS